MTLVREHKTAPESRKTLPGEAYLLKDSKNLKEVPKSVSVVLHERGFDLYSYAADYESVTREAVRYTETLIRCALNEITASVKPYVIQLEAGLRTIFICFGDREERDGCFTKILASVGQFLVSNPRSRKSQLGKRTSNPLSPVSPLSIATVPSLQEEQLSLLLNALDITSSTTTRCLATSRLNSAFTFRFPALLVSLCNAKPLRRTHHHHHHHHAKEQTTHTPVVRSYTLPFSKFGNARSCKRFSARNAVFCDDNHTRSSLEKRAALGILNTDLGDARQYLARF